MTSSFRELLKDLLPPVVKRWAAVVFHRLFRRGTVFAGHYADWETAASAATGYSTPEILERTRKAVLLVKRGEARFERDSVILPEPEYSFPALTALLGIAAQSEGRLDVVDFGGSLGSSFFQFRPLLAGVSSLRWAVVEQAHFVECGRREIAGDGLSFHATITEAIEASGRRLFFASSVLQYLPDPGRFIEELLEYRFDYILIDRTAFHSGLRDRLTLQRNPSTLYAASYPAWFFNEERFIARFAAAYRVIYAFDGRDQVLLANGRPYYRGFFLQRK